MPTNDDYLAELTRASEVLQHLSGEDVDAIDVKSVESEEAPFLAKIVSKLSPMVGNLMEQRVVSILDDDASAGYSWHRQDPGFPDAILKHISGAQTYTGYEIKAWYVLSTEITGRFRESQRLLAGKNVNVVILAWCMSHLIFGKPKILGVLTVSGRELSESRDTHYHNPPEYLIVEPQNTIDRTANLRQSNVNGYKLQEADSDAEELSLLRSRFAAEDVAPAPHSEEAQEIANDLMNRLKYRLDTNFAKIDRVDNANVQQFKSKILSSVYLNRKISEWKTIFADLNGNDEAKRERAESVIRSLYTAMASEEPKTAVVVESEDAR